jgi:hypothetical protein
VNGENYLKQVSILIFLIILKSSYQVNKINQVKITVQTNEEWGISEIQKKLVWPKMRPMMNRLSISTRLRRKGGE